MTGRNSPRAVALITSADLPDLAPDDRLLAAAFHTAGWAVHLADWHHPVPRADLAIVRSCWDYIHAPEAFLAALEHIATAMPLWNPLPTMRWNLDKRYLLELAQAGLPVPPTRVVERGMAIGVQAVLDGLGVDEVVAKPVVGAGGEDTERFTRVDEARWRALATRRDLLVQPYLPEVRTAGEVSLTFLDGAYSHAVVKHPADGEFRVQEEHGGRVTPWVASDALVTVGTAALAAVPHPWRYARVDGIMTPTGFQLMEIELVEPELFFRARPESAAAFVAGFRS